MSFAHTIDILKKNLGQWSYLKISISTKQKKSNCDKTQQLKLGPNLKTQKAKKFNSNCDKTQKLKLGEKIKTHIMTKLETQNLNSNKT